MSESLYSSKAEARSQRNKFRRMRRRVGKIDDAVSELTDSWEKFMEALQGFLANDLVPEGLKEELREESEILQEADHIVDMVEDCWVGRYDNGWRWSERAVDPSYEGSDPWA